MNEYELKARLEEPTDRFTERLRAAGWRSVFRGEISDRRLDTPDRRLERRDEVLRLREMRSDDGEVQTILAWKGPATEERGFKLREEIETCVSDPVAARALLERLGYEATTLIIDRAVHVFEKDGVVARVEEYPEMDVLVELEGDPEHVEARLSDLGLPREAWKSWPLETFVGRYEARTGKPARLHCRNAHQRSPEQ